MIFLTIGSHEPFDRLIRAVDAWCETSGQGDQVFGQITARAEYQPKHFEATATLGPADYDARFQASDLIISHAGMGSIIAALTHCKPIVVLPRRGHLAETRNDHQYATLKGLGARDGLYPALTEDDLPDVLSKVQKLGAKAAPKTPLGPFAQPQLTTALRELIFS